jgi:NADH-quinone oxidoreductase subunit L
VLGFALLLGIRPPERLVGPSIATALAVSLASAAAALVLILGSSSGYALVSLGRWFEVGHTAFELDLLVDPLGLTFVILTVAVGGVVAAFAHRYLHREPGYHRFFLLFCLFVGGMLLVVLAGTMEVLFAGWELIGIGSALLIAFFHERPAPVHNALRVAVLYRVGDAAMLSAAVLVHHELGTGSLGLLMTGAADGTNLDGAAATAVGLLLVFAAAIKCAQLPFVTWLPRAMEGPTPSSAVFYGALSVHAGAFVLLRFEPVLQRSPIACVALGVLGIATAVVATIIGRAQTDIKSALAFASSTQLGVILLEIACGLRWIAVVHMLGHACLRLLQFLRAPSLLHDVHQVENAVGGHLARTGLHLERWVPPEAQWRLYRVALGRGGFEAFLDGFVVRPFVRVLSMLDRCERRIIELIAAPRSIAGGRRRG